MRDEAVVDGPYYCSSSMQAVSAFVGDSHVAVGISSCLALVSSDYVLVEGASFFTCRVKMAAACVPTFLGGVSDSSEPTPCVEKRRKRGHQIVSFASTAVPGRWYLVAIRLFTGGLV